ncbi:hypothetical protein OEZ86_001448 [Tetradesmus obliquus]|nr:hypothetical protein OEZ86_001448 [Tetradesmus obliquus]
MQPALQRLLWVLLALAAVRSVMANEVFVGQIQETAVHGKESSFSTSRKNHDAVHVHTQHHHLRLKTGELRRMLFPREPAVLPRSGSWVMVCGQGPATTPEKLAAALFEGEADSQPETLQGMFSSCSYGNADFSRSAGCEVVSATVPIDCSGKTPWGAPFDSLTCPYTEWSDVANDYVKHVLGINWEDFKYKVYVVPPGELCSWGGMGWVGCKSDCRAWISGDLWMFPTTWMHELGHNLYLNHAGSFQPLSSGGNSQYIAYKDDSGAMGHCCSTRCFNAPHSFQLGWSKALDSLSKGNFAAGEWRSYVLPPRVGPSSKDVNLIRVSPDWDGPAAAYNFFLEYRKAASYDAGLLPSVRDKVTLYSTPVGDSMPFTTLEVAVGQNQISHESRIGSHLAIWVGSESAEGMSVNLCRPLSDHEISCSDGRDDDCDGFIDEEDSDCQARTTTSRKLLS